MADAPTIVPAHPGFAVLEFEQPYRDKLLHHVIAWEIHDNKTVKPITISASVNQQVNRFILQPGGKVYDTETQTIYHNADRVIEELDKKGTS